jgi:hypothetical protein
MQKKRPWLALLISCAAACAASGVLQLAGAAQMTAGSSGAVMGQPLDFVVLVRLAEGESVSPECVAAEVMLGERKLAPGEVRTSVQSSGPGLASIRVVTRVPVDEPVVDLAVHTGCGAQLTRRFVVLADAPGMASAPSAEPAAAPRSLPLASALPPASAPGVVDVVAAAEVAASGVQSSGVALASNAAASAYAPARASAYAPPRRASPRRAASQASAAQVAQVAQVVKRRGGPRLELELAEPRASTEVSEVVERALQAVAAAASAAEAAASAASASAAQVTALQLTVARLQEEARIGRREDPPPRERVMDAAPDSGRWTWPLLAASLVLTVLSGWLGWHLAARQQVRQSDWREVLGAARAPVGPEGPGRVPTAPIPFVTSEIRLPTPPAPGAAARPRSAPAWPPPAASETHDPPTVAAPLPGARPTRPDRQAPVSPRRPPEVSRPDPVSKSRATPPPPVAAVPPPLSATDPAVSELPTQRTDVLPYGSEGRGPHDVSIEELIDLEQQAEFFVVLGQDEAAIDMLVAHLRHTGGGSPLPYLKLLEIYGRRHDLEAYERMRVRFSQRFNTNAPEWGADLQAGRALEGHAGVIPRLQQVWPRPLDAMAELEALLFRKSRGDMFELPAYREVLFLYAIARDLLDREGADSGSVDLLLPMPDGGAFGITAPSPLIDLGRPGDPVQADADDRSNSSLDLDLSTGFDRPPSIFDLIDEPPAKGR